MEFSVKEGQNVEIGIEKSSKIDNDWAIFDNFTLRYLGKEGDVNNDNLVGIADVTALVNILLGKDSSAYNTFTADVNLDGQVSISDVTSLVNLILGK